MANRKKKRKQRNSNVKKADKPNSIERDIEKFKLYSVVVHTIGTLIINFKDQIMKLFS